MVVPRKKQKGAKNVFVEIMAENLPNPKEETDNQVQEAESQIRWNRRDSN